MGIIRVIRNFFIGPRPRFRYINLGWQWTFSFVPYIWWAEGFHFNELGVRASFGPHFIELSWVDNN